MKFQIYRDKSGGHRWRLRAPNGRIIADGSEAYQTRDGVRQAVRRMQHIALADVPVVEETK